MSGSSSRSISSSVGGAAGLLRSMSTHTHAAGLRRLLARLRLGLRHDPAEQLLAAARVPVDVREDRGVVGRVVEVLARPAGDAQVAVDARAARHLDPRRDVLLVGDDRLQERARVRGGRELARGAVPSASVTRQGSRTGSVMGLAIRVAARHADAPVIDAAEPVLVPGATLAVCQRAAPCFCAARERRLANRSSDSFQGWSSTPALRSAPG